MYYSFGKNLNQMNISKQNKSYLICSKEGIFVVTLQFELDCGGVFLL